MTLRQRAQTASSAASNPVEADLELGLARDLRRIAQTLDNYSKQVTAQSGLTLVQLTVLGVLDETGALTSGALSRAVFTSAATLTTVLDRLESRDLVARVRGTGDRRQVVVALRPAGRRLLKRAPALLPPAFLAALRAQPPRRQASLADTVHTLADLFVASPVTLDAGPVARENAGRR